MIEQSLWSYVAHASLIVKFVMLLLLTASLGSWTLIFQRGFSLKVARRQLNHFENAFWSGADLSRLYQDLQHQPNASTGLAAIFQSGFKEFLRLSQQSTVKTKALIESVSRAMRVAQNREIDRLEEHLPLLATVGSVSPYVGLFGTVWGIMISFQALSGGTQATIAMVAPGISEALIATAMGLFAAIPAVIAYNRYMYGIDRLVSRFESFQEEFVNMLQHYHLTEEREV